MGRVAGSIIVVLGGGPVRGALDRCALNATARTTLPVDKKGEDFLKAVRLRHRQAGMKLRLEGHHGDMRNGRSRPECTL